MDTGLPKGQKRSWLTSEAFSDIPGPKPLTRLEQFVHALMMSNEFVTID